MDSPDEPYLMSFHTVHSSTIRRMGKFKFGHVKGYTGRNARDYVLCGECKNYLVERQDDSKNMWPLFLYSVLFGSHKSVFFATQYHYSVHRAEDLWRLIPQSMREWWIDEIKLLAEYSDCTLDHPSSIFEDKTMDIKQFNTNYTSGQLAQVVEAMENENVINCNVLCPWSCSTSCRVSGRLPLDLMIQRLLPRVNLTLYSDASNYRLVHSCTNNYFRDDDQYARIMLNEEWVVKPSIVLEDGCLKVITCKWHDGGHDKLTLYAPQSPHGHVLNAEQSDQLAPCVRKHQVSKPMKAYKYCTKFQMFQVHSGYSGVSTMGLTTHSDFSRSSELLSQHEGASIIGRDDINLLLSKKVANKQISAEHARNFVRDARHRFSEQALRQYTQGATFVKFSDMIAIQLFESSDQQNIEVMNDCPTRLSREQKKLWVRRSWPIRINLLQTEDCKGFGTQFRPIPSFNTGQKPSALTWTVFAVLSSCPSLWCAVDTKPSPFRWSRWEGWILTAIQHHCFKFETISVDSRSPFKKLQSMARILPKVNSCLPPVLDNDGADYYRMDAACFETLFPGDEYSGVAIFSSIEDAIDPTQAEILRKKKVILVADDIPPSRGNHMIGHSRFDLQVVCIVRAKQKGNSPSKYDAIRYMRHDGFDSFWKQERNKSVVTQCIGRDNIYQELEETWSDDCFFYKCVSVYVRAGVDNTEGQWETKFFQSMGGKPHVRCQCRQYPLLPSKKPKDNKLKCNARCFVRADGTHVERNHGSCPRIESYVCSNPECNIRICKRCYDRFPLDGVSTIIPSSNQQDENDNDQMTNTSNEEDDLSEHDSEDDELGDSENDEDLQNYEVANDDLVESMENFVISSAQDSTLDLTEDNRNSVGFMSTDTGDLPVDVETSLRSDTVSGHVIFNQAGRCVSRRNGQINGINREKHWIQSMCSTTPGQPCPLLQPEASLFPRHFYAAAETDRRSILGARPLFLLSHKKHPHGFSPALQHARIRMTDPSSSTSTDPKLMCSHFDELGNIALNSNHSRDVFERGFVVEDKSTSGMAVRDKGNTDLSESVDSRRMVMNLATSQKYIKYTWFLTKTCNQKEHPGLAHLHEWKNSMQWTKSIPGYTMLSQFEKDELKKAMEESSGPHVYSNWNAVKYMFLTYIKKYLTVLGTNSAIFARDEYQADAGNLCHNHLIFAVDRSTMNADSEKFIQDLIRTSVMEVLNTNEDVERLLENGLLKSVDDIPVIVDRADVILRHNCDERCKVRVGEGEGPENFRCRKMNSVKDSPDPTCHNYIQFNHKYQESTLEVLEEIGIYEPPPDGSDAKTRGTFSHAFFDPARHIAPCNWNADCNMSPVIPDFFVALKSMQNAQALDHTNGVAKYVCKYIGKFDEGNYVVLCQDIHTGKWVLGKTHLHNTKIVTSKFNEDKAFEKERNKNHPKGRDMPYFEIRQIIMGDAEVFTNLTFISLSTLPFELRPTNSIKLDNKGNVINTNPDYDAELNVADAYASGVPMQRARLQINLPEYHRMTDGQMITYRNHNGKAARYDMISLFSLRPPELLSVIRNPVDYYRCCYIVEDKLLNEEAVENMLSDDLRVCPWIDCLGRRIKLRELALNELLVMVEKNLEEFEALDEYSEQNEFRIEMNLTVKDMIEAYQASEAGIDHDDEIWVETTVADFIHVEDSEESRNLPIPVVSNTSPTNAHQFLIHIVLSLGKYDTEFDALTHRTSRDCFRSAGLIGNATDVVSLKQYSNQLCRKYIEEQVVYYPNSISRAETIVVMAKKVFDDAIIHNALSMNELPPFTMTTLRTVRTEENDLFWRKMKNSQLNSVYASLEHTPGVPSRQSVSEVDRENPMVWNPTNTIPQYERQSEESYEEQKEAINLCVNQINKYRNANEGGQTTYTKNPVVYGAPGTGKSFVGEIVVLYAIMQGLNIISTALMGVRANAIGGTHLHEFFKLPINDNATVAPQTKAMQALEKIKRKTDLYHALLTLDAIFLDEAGQVSSDELATIDIILRKGRRSQTPFGGVMIIGTMDPSQLKPINQQPLLTSSLMLTCFVMFELKHSVRAHGDKDFQRLQAITRMDPFELLASPELKREFYKLARKIFTYVLNWNSPKIGPNMMRAFSRVLPAQEALDDYRESIRLQLTNEGTLFQIATSIDTQKIKGSSADYSPANEQSINALNKELKEPTELVLFPGGVYEFTINDKRRGFNQSQLAFILDLPSAETVANHGAINIWIAPPATSHMLIERDQLPTRQQLQDRGWTETTVGCAAERDVNVRGGLVARRVQYSLKHIGATTINKSQGATLPYGIAVEISEKYSPWESGQIVVSLSRSETAKMTVIVGERKFAINKMWELITTGDQWTRYTKHILNTISVNGDAVSNRNIFDYPEVYPFRRMDSVVPTDTTGYVYCLSSIPRPCQIYIGQTQCLSQRYKQHREGGGTDVTNDIRNHPWALSAYICGLSHMQRRERESLERSWKDIVQDMRLIGQDSSYRWIMAGKRVVDLHNSGVSNVDEHIRFVCHVMLDTDDSE